MLITSTPEMDFPGCAYLIFMLHDQAAHGVQLTQRSAQWLRPYCEFAWVQFQRMKALYPLSRPKLHLSYRELQAIATLWSNLRRA
jgi:hypothetical protein